MPTTNAAKHTPVRQPRHSNGPWRVSGIPQFADLIVSDALGIEVALICEGSEMSGNADLIAAAPELLAAMEIIADKLACFRSDRPSEWLLQEWETIARDAIEKARGSV